MNDDELKRRLLKRGELSARPDDRNPEVIENRIQVYKNETIPVAQHYAKQGKLQDIPGEGSIDETFALLAEAIDRVK